MPVQNIAHLGICVADPDRSMRFYCDLLGFRPVTKLMVSDKGSAKLCELPNMDLHSYFIERDGIRIELLHYLSPGFEEGSGPRPMNRQGLTHLAMRVEGLGDMLDAIEADGFEILKKTHIGSSETNAQVVFVLDPDGVRIELIELPGDPTAPLGEPLPG